ncbi:MAG: hypothetical protein GY823_11140 [Flavobacteriaceae bacterium]|nr:hypothetical protein [Flavobacteriaceae bacterium]
MPIKSYIAYPFEGKKDVLIDDLNEIKQCEVIPSKNKEIVVVVTETPSNEEDIKLKELIDNLESLKMISLVSGFNTPKNN